MVTRRGFGGMKGGQSSKVNKFVSLNYVEQSRLSQWFGFRSGASAWIPQGVII